MEHNVCRLCSAAIWNQLQNSMSYDLAVWYPHRKFSNGEAGKIYSTLWNEGSELAPHQKVTNFYIELTRLHPEIGDIPEDQVDDLELCPWSAPHDVTDRYVVMHFVYSHAGAVSQMIAKLAQKHSLALYDPQQAKVYIPIASRRREVSVRMVGIVLLLVGALMGLAGVYFPYAAIVAGERDQTIHMLPVILAPATFGLGLPYALFGERAKTVFGHPQQPNAVQIVVCVALLLMGYATYTWLKGLLVSL